MRSPTSVLAYKLSIVMFLYSVCRILFYLFNLELFPDVTIANFMIMMLGGLRFDLSAVLYINFLFILLQLIPFKFRQSSIYQKRLDYLFFFTNAIGLALNCIDFIYFRFTQRRTTFTVFDEFKNEQNYLQLAKHFFLDFYYILLIWILLITTMIWLSKKVKVGNSYWSGLKYYGLNTMIILGLLPFIVIGMRSGIPPRQDFPLVPSDAGEYTTNPNNIAIVQNTPFCMLRTSGRQVYKKKDYFPEKELASIYSPIHNPDSIRDFKKMNAERITASLNRLI